MWRGLSTWFRTSKKSARAPLRPLFQANRVPLKVFEIDELQRVDVCRFQHHRTGEPGFERLLPPRNAHAPPVARLESGKPVHRERRTQVVSDVLLVREELGRDLTADRVQPFIFRTGVAAPVAVEARERAGGTGLQWAAENV